MSKSPVRVAVTGAAGQIGYSLLFFRIASGEMLGKDQPVIIQMLDPASAKGLPGVIMELDDCAFPFARWRVCHRRSERRLQGCRHLLARWRPSAYRWHGARRSAERKRRDLYRQARPSPKTPGKTSGSRRRQSVQHQCLHRRRRCQKVGRTNPANYHGMLRLDYNRAASQLAAKDWSSGFDDQQARGLGQPLPDDVRRLPQLRFNGDSVKA